ncbi:MAG: extracellular solute-binding protein [Rhodopseudomonas palustris]|nr:extracellular solute-binding protein [Rhodopseudomonas palustris]
MPPDMEAWVKKNWPEYSVKANTAEDGKLFDFPWFNAFKMMFYNKDYFKEAGITKVPTTVEEMIAASRKLDQVRRQGKRDARGSGLPDHGRWGWYHAEVVDAGHDSLRGESHRASRRQVARRI